MDWCVVSGVCGGLGLCGELDCGGDFLLLGGML